MLTTLTLRHEINLNLTELSGFTPSAPSPQKNKKEIIRHHQNELCSFVQHILNTVSVLFNQACAIFITRAGNCIKVTGCPWGSISYMGSECGWGLYHQHLLFELRYVMSFPLLPTDLMSLWKYITLIPFPTPSLSSAQLCVPLNRSLEMDYGFALRKLPLVTSYVCLPTALICIAEGIIAPTICREICQLCFHELKIIWASTNRCHHISAALRWFGT